MSWWKLVNLPWHEASYLRDVGLIHAEAQAAYQKQAERDAKAGK